MTAGQSGTIVVGVDGSEASFHALDRAVKIAAAFESEIIVSFVRQLPPVLGDEPGDVIGVYEDSLDDAQDKSKNRTTQICDGAGIKWRLVVRDGDPAKQLIEAAHEHNASLIVVGARMHGAVSSVMLSTVASYLVHHSDVSFTVIRPLDEES